MLSKKIVINKYMSVSSLQQVGLLDDVNMYLTRMGWEAFVMMQYPTYVRPTYKFLSFFHFDNQALLLTSEHLDRVSG